MIQSSKYTQKFKKLAHGATEKDLLLLCQIANVFSLEKCNHQVCMTQFEMIFQVQLG